MTHKQWAAAIQQLKQAQGEIQEAINAEDGSHDLLLEQLVPYAEIVSEYEGHHDFTRVLERELDL